MARLSIKTDGSIRIIKSFNRLSNTILSTSNIMTWFRRFADPYMRKQFRKSFETQTAPNGSAWKRLKPSTVARRGSSRPILRRKGGLMRSVTQKRGEASVSFNSLTRGREIEMRWGHNIRLNVRGGFDKYKIHQLGASNKNIPARPMIGFRKGNSAHLGRSLNIWITNQLRVI